MIDLIQKYLEISNYADKKTAFEDLFQSHPDYPSLFAVTDALELLAIENTAAKISKEELYDLPDCFLAMYNQQLAFVSKTKKNIKVKLAKGDQKKVSFDDFAESWNGIVIVIEPNQNLSSRYLKLDLKWFYFSLPILAILICSIFYNRYDVNSTVFLLTSIAGLIFSILAVKEKLGLKNDIVSKFCNKTPDISCNTVITSEKGKINRWINFSDLPVLFFGINLTALLLNPIGMSNLIGLLSLFSLPVIAYTVWMQKMKLKKWCLLCLAIAAVVVFQSVIGLQNKEYFSNITVSQLYFYFFSAVFIGAFWLAISNLLVIKIKTQQEVIDLKKLKRNYAVFNFLSKEIADLKGLDELTSIKFGNENSTVCLVLIISPACKFCDIALEQALELVNRYPKKVSLKVLYNINPQNKDNPYKLVAESLLEINSLNKAMAVEAVVDWHIKKIGLAKWKEKWEISSVSLRTSLQLEEQYNWCRENEFSYTPIKIVNDRLFPNEYDISDLKYFIKNYSEEKPIVEQENLVSL